MKKTLLIGALIALFVTSLYAKPRASAEPVTAVERFVLDAALKQAAKQFSDSLPEHSVVAVIGLSSGATDLDDYMVDEFTTNLVRLHELEIVTRANLEAIKREMNFQMSGEVSDETMQELGAKLGAQTVFSGSLRPIGNKFVLNIQALEVATARIQDIYRAQVDKDEVILALYRPASAAPTAPATAAPAPSAAPRPAVVSGYADAIKTEDDLIAAGYTRFFFARSAEDNIVFKNAQNTQFEISVWAVSKKKGLAYYGTVLVKSAKGYKGNPLDRDLDNFTSVYFKIMNDSSAAIRDLGVRWSDQYYEIVR